MTEPIQAWYPLAKVRFQIRVEDFADDAPLPVAVAPDTGSEAFGLAQEHQEGGDFVSSGYDTVPYTVNVERNSYRQADECRLTIPLARMPFDPRVIRAATVQIFGGVVDPAAYAESMQKGNLGLLIPDATAGGASNELFRGFVDEWEITLSDHDVLEVTARDLTSFLVDAEIPENALRDIPDGTRLDDVIRLILFGGAITDETGKALVRREGLSGVRGLVVRNATGDDLPVINQIKPPNWFDSKRTLKKGKKRAVKDAQKMSYWDMITDLCLSAGFICYIRSDTQDDADPTATLGQRAQPAAAELVISNPRTYYQKATQFGDLIIPQTEVREFFYGINVDELKIRRKFGGTKVPTIEIRNHDARTGKDLIGRFPKRAKNNKPAPSGRGDREEVQVFALDDVSGPDAQVIIDAAAESIYQQLSRGEMEVQLKTKVLSALPRNATPQIVSREGSTTPPVLDADMFRMVAGDPIIVTIDQADVEAGRVSQFTLLQASTPEAQVQAMEIAGVRRDVAQRIAVANQSDFVQTEFRLQKSIMTWTFEHGWEFELHAINFLVIRHAVELGEDEVEIK